MSTPERPVLPDHPTKQQLDELDALMERMLALPVNQADNLISLPKPAPRPVKTVSLPVLQLSMAVAEMPKPQEVSMATVISSSLQASPKAPVRAEQQQRHFVQSPVPLGLRPVVWCNRVYDSSIAKLGPPGRWLRGARGRTMLGLTGIALLTAALAWVAVDTWGWTW